MNPNNSSDWNNHAPQQAFFRAHNTRAPARFRANRPPFPSERQQFPPFRARPHRPGHQQRRPRSSWRGGGADLSSIADRHSAPPPKNEVADFPRADEIDVSHNETYREEIAGLRTELASEFFASIADEHTATIAYSGIDSATRRCIFCTETFDTDAQLSEHAESEEHRRSELAKRGREQRSFEIDDDVLDRILGQERFRLDLYDDRLGRHVLDDDDDGCGGGRELLRVDAVQLSGEPLLDSNADDDTCCAALGDDGEPIGDDHEWVAAIGCRFTKAIIGRVGDDEANEALIDAHLQSEAFLAHDDRPQYLTSHYLPTSTVPAYDATAGTTLWEEDMRRLCRPDYFNTS